MKTFVIFALFAIMNSQFISSIKDNATCEKDVTEIASSFVDLLNDLKFKKWSGAFTDVINIVDHVAHVEAECQSVEPLFDSIVDLWIANKNVADEAQCKANWKASFPNVIRLVKDVSQKNFIDMLEVGPAVIKELQAIEADCKPVQSQLFGVDATQTCSSSMTEMLNATKNLWDEFAQNKPFNPVALTRDLNVVLTNGIYIAGDCISNETEIQLMLFPLLEFYQENFNPHNLTGCVTGLYDIIPIINKTITDLTSGVNTTVLIADIEALVVTGNTMLTDCAPQFDNVAEPIDILDTMYEPMEVEETMSFIETMLVLPQDDLLELELIPMIGRDQH